MLTKRKTKKGPGSLMIGFMIGLPLAALCIGLIAYSANTAYQEQSYDKPMTDPVYDRPAYSANSKAPSDVDFDSEDIKFATGKGTTVITPQVSETVASTSGNGGTANGGYNASQFSGVYTDESAPVISQQTSSPSAGENKADKGTGSSTYREKDIWDDDELETLSQTDPGSEFVERTGNDISDQIWKDDNVTTYNSFTQLDVVADAGGKVGTVSIPSINLKASIYRSDIDEMEAMKNGVAHFNITSSWDGNVGLCAHNWTESGNGAYFKELNQVSKGDTITYTTSLGTRTYKVSSITTIDESDWSYLNRTDDNRLTLITCTFNDSSKRLCVQAVAV